MTPNTASNGQNVSHTFSLDLRWIVLLLVAVIGVMLFIWKPWSSTASDRTIEVTGETTITAAPDEFAFYPTYQFTNAKKETALQELTKKTESITAELKNLGVEEKNIKTTASGYENLIFMQESNGDATYSSQVVITVGSQELAQKVQDYLLTTEPTGSVSPTPTFSDSKRKELEAQARDEATKDARAKAEQSGKNLGFKVGKVKTVSDGSGFAVPYEARGETAMAIDDKVTSSLTVYPGENELPYSVTVVYYIR